MVNLRGITVISVLGLAVLAGSCAHAPNRIATSLPTNVAPSAQPLPLTSATPAAPTVIKPSAAPAPDPVGELIAKVEAIYTEGQKEYQAGNLEGSKDKFDQALAMLLESKFDVRSDDRLYAEFEKLVDGTYGVEVAAVESGNSLSEHPYEPAPIESFAGLTFPVDPNVRLRAQEEMHSLHSDLPLISNDIVDGYLSFFQFQERGHAYIEKVLRRLGEYRPMISQILGQKGLPQDLIYLAAGESAFNPFAVSTAYCVGIWQFGLETGRGYGLKRNRWVDDREDPVKSTEAAAAHLKDLYQEFGDWYLAMAAYDSGSLTVQRAIERTGYADFWKLRELHALPPETENYVPIFLAIALICKDPRAYGFSVVPDPPLDPDQVVTPVPTDLRLLADIVGAPVVDIVKLNPSLLRWTTPADDPKFVLYLPHGTKDQYEKVIASIPPSKRIWWRTYKVEGDETLAEIASKYRISTSSLEKANKIEPGDPMNAGDILVLPLPPGRTSLARVNETGSRRLTWYRIRQGDSLDVIADRFDVTAYQIRRWNGLRSSHIVAGHLLRLYVIRHPARRSSYRAVSAGLHFYRIRPGDSLYGIASRFGVKVSQIRRWNGLENSSIVAGRMLKIYAP